MENYTLYSKLMSWLKSNDLVDLFSFSLFKKFLDDLSSYYAFLGSTSSY